MSATKPLIVFFHNYYGEHSAWIDLLIAKVGMPFKLYYNVVNESLYNDSIDVQDLARSMAVRCEGAGVELHFRVSGNRGKDIGGKLILIDSWLKVDDGDGYALLLHDKRSPHKVDPEAWKSKLFRVMEPDFIEQAISAFESDPGVGVVAAYGTVSVADKADPVLLALAHMYNIDIRNDRYVAGTIFWMRTEQIRRFFLKFNPLNIRAGLESGNVLDDSGPTTTHAWERLFTKLALNGELKIKEY